MLKRIIGWALVVFLFLGILAISYAIGGLAGLIATVTVCAILALAIVAVILITS